MFGLGVVGLELVVRDRPGRRHAAVVPELAEVLAPEPEQRRAVELGVAAHPVVRVRVEILPLRVTPVLARLVATLDVHRPGAPVVGLTGYVVAALEEQDPLARGRQAVEQGAAAGSG